MNTDPLIERQLEEALPLQREEGRDWDDVLDRAGERRRRPRQYLALVALLVLVGVPSAYAVGPRLLGLGGGGTEGGGDVAPAVEVDERQGVLRGVRFGDSGLEVLDRLGAPSDDEQGFFPADAAYTGPPSVPLPRSDAGTRVPPATLHFQDTAYLVSETSGVFAMATLAEGASTRAGVGVGDDLDDARDAYDTLECGRASAGESLVPGFEPTYEWCRTRVGRVQLFFGGDPIESITLSVTAER